MAFGGSMTITLFFPSINIASVSSTDVALTKQLAVGHETGFNLEDPFLQGKNKPTVVALKADPKTGQPLAERDFGVSCINRERRFLPVYCIRVSWVRASSS